MEADKWPEIKILDLSRIKNFAAGVLKAGGVTELCLAEHQPRQRDDVSAEVGGGEVS